MKKIFCLESHGAWKHPLVTSALNHPDLEFTWDKTYSGFHDAGFVHSIPDPLPVPSIFHLEECRSTWWYSGHSDCLAEMPPASIIDKIRAQLLTFRKIIVHLPATARVIPKLYGDEVGEKVVQARLGIAQYDPKVKPETTRFIFTNSFHNDLTNFNRRGGREVVEAFKRVRRAMPCELILAVPGYKLDEQVEGIRLINSAISDDTMDFLFASSHVLLLPSIDLHSHSILRARAHGCVPVVCGCPGVSEYVSHEETGIIVGGRQDWRYDDRTGQWFSVQNPEAVYRPDLTDQLEAAMKRLASSPGETKRFGEQVRELTRQHFPLQGWQDAVCGEILKL